MSIFASRTQKTIPIPFDPPHTVTIQKLAGRHLERANEANTFAAMEMVQKLGSELKSELSKVGDKAQQAAAITKAQADPLNSYDKYVVLRFGIKAWTYPESLAVETVTNARGESVQVIPALDDLDDEAVTFLATEILRLSKPSLFLMADVAAEQEKNDESRSIAS